MMDKITWDMGNEFQKYISDIEELDKALVEKIELSLQDLVGSSEVTISDDELLIKLFSPPPVDLESVNARLEDDVLSITLSLKNESGGRKK